MHLSNEPMHCRQLAVIDYLLLPLGQTMHPLRYFPPQTQTLRLLASLGSNLVEVEPIRDTLVVSKDK